MHRYPYMYPAVGFPNGSCLSVHLVSCRGVNSPGEIPHPLATTRSVPADLGAVTGRDHHPYAFSLFMAGGGLKRGYTYGETDEIGWSIVKDPVHINDFHATMLHLFGMNHLKLTHRFQGLDARLTGIAGKVIKDWVA